MGEEIATLVQEVVHEMLHRAERRATRQELATKDKAKAAKTT
jgi:hypothetical protein